MSTLAGTALTLVDIAKQMDPNGAVAHIVEILTQTNEILEDMTFIECNDGSKHETTIRTGLPASAWIGYNEGTSATKGTTAQIVATTGHLSSKSQIDKRLAEKGGMDKVKGVRANEAVAHIAGMSQDMATAVLYEDERTNPKRITGLAAHYSTVSTATALSAENVIDGGGTGSDNTSIWLVCWGPSTVTGLIPQGSKVGLVHEDDGIVDVVDSTGIAGSTYKAYRDNFTWDTGLCVRDWRYAARICNIDVSNLVALSSNADLVTMMIKLEERIQNLGMGKCGIYMNRTVREMLRILALTRSLYQLSFDTVAGKRLLMWNGIPIRRVDSILNTEARLT